MIRSRREKNVLGGRGLVKKSAMLSALCTKGTVISRDSTRSRTKKCQRLMCLVRAWCSGLYAKSIADVLSMESEVGFTQSTPSSEKSARRYTASLVASEAATISPLRRKRGPPSAVSWMPTISPPGRTGRRTLRWNAASPNRSRSSPAIRRGPRSRNASRRHD
eukprot:5059568-Pleurochrysis_carterae.AAC.1